MDLAQLPLPLQQFISLEAAQRVQNASRRPSWSNSGSVRRRGLNSSRICKPSIRRQTPSHFMMSQAPHSNLILKMFLNIKITKNKNCQGDAKGNFSESLPTTFHRNFRKRLRRSRIKGVTTAESRETQQHGGSPEHPITSENSEGPPAGR